jgi:putative RNA 2'-phosphotransferase
MDKKLVTVSKFLSLVLRHKPDEIGLTLDENGWADVNELLKKSNANKVTIDLQILKEVVDTNEKKRFSFNEDYSKIRANQGHSIEVDVQLRSAIPPDTLYHGTAESFLDEILRVGLNKMQRLYVHLSDNCETAIKVGQRHGKPAILIVDAKAMSHAGIEFFLSENSVWLVNHVQVKYLRRHVG